MSPHQALGEAFGSLEALGDRFCGLEKAQETSLGHLGVQRVWQMWIFLLVAKLVAGFLQNLKKSKTHQLGSQEPEEIRRLEYSPFREALFLNAMNYR